MLPSNYSKLRILLIAEACNPTWTSVPLVGYNFARAITGHPQLDVTLVTHPRNRPALDADAISRTAKIEYINNEFVAGPLYKLAKVFRGGDKMAWTIDTAMAWPSYMVFEWLLFRRYKQQLRAGEFDLIHRVTPLSPIMGSPLVKRTKVPMLIGPINGGLPWPKEYPELRKAEREWLIPFRGLSRWLPYYRSAYRRFAGVITASKQTASELPTLYRGRRFFMPENGVDPARFPLADDWHAPSDAFTFITVGRLVPLKAVDMIIEAIAGSSILRKCKLKIVGDGPEREKLESQAKTSGVGDNIEFVGWLDQVSLGQQLHQSQAFLFPSLKDFGGGVVLEAMAAALPSIVVDYGGPGELVDADTGLKLPMKPRQPLTAALRAAMESLVLDPDRCRRFGRAAVAKVRQQYTWSAKADLLVGMYRELLAR